MDLLKIPDNYEIITLIGNLSTHQFRRIFFHFSNYDKINIDKKQHLKFLLIIGGSNKKLLTHKLNSLINENIQEDFSYQTKTKILVIINSADYDSDYFSLEQNQTDFVTVFNLSKYIFYISVTEEQLFDNCMNHRYLKSEYYESIWPCFVKLTECLLDLIVKINLRSKFYVIDSQNNYNVFQNVIDNIENDEKLVQKLYSNNIDQILERVRRSPKHRTSEYVHNLINQTKRKFFPYMHNLEREFCSSYYQNKSNDKLRMETIISLIREYESTHFFMDEQRSVFKNVFSSGNLCNILLDELIYLAKTLPNCDLSLESLNTDNMDKTQSVLISGCNVLSSIANHIIFKHNIFTNQKYIQLIAELLSSNSYLIRIEATKFITQMLITDYKRYGYSLIEYDKKYKISIVVILYNTIYELFSLISNANLDHPCLLNVTNYIKNNMSVTSLELVLKGSLENAYKLSETQITDLINLTVKLDEKYQYFKNYLHGVLSMLLKYGPKQVWLNDSNVISLLEDCHKIVLNIIKCDSFSSYSLKTPNLYTNLLIQLKTNKQQKDNEGLELGNDFESMIEKHLNDKDADFLIEILDLFQETNLNIFMEILFKRLIQSDSFNSSYIRMMTRLNELNLLKPEIVLANLNKIEKNHLIRLANFVSELYMNKILSEDLILNLVKSWLEQKVDEPVFVLLVLVGRESSLFEHYFNKLEKDSKFEYFFNQLDKNNWENKYSILKDYFSQKSNNFLEKFYNSILNIQKINLNFEDEINQISSYEKLELKIENENLKLKLKSLEASLSRLKSDNNKLELECINRKNEVNNLRLKIEEMNSNFSFMEKQNLIKHEIKEVETKPQISSESISEIEIPQDMELNYETSKQILEQLKFKRDNLKDFRKLICGSLKHLSVNLYTSPHHFLAEIIQNFEDNDYSLELKPWYMKIIIDKEYLIFCNNETGFKIKDVLSICSCSESSKSKGKHIGHKGLGFKSVFLCSDNPVIVSKPYWSFEFKKEAQNDEIAFITPIYLDKSNWPDNLNNSIQLNPDSSTYIYLPLKQCFKYNEQNVKYFSSLKSNIDPNILLFTNKLEKIIIEDKIEETITIIESIEENFDENEHYKTSIKKISIEKQGLMKEIKIKLFKKQIRIPNDLVEDENLESNETEITIGFPFNNSNCKIFAFLPVCDLGFKFLVNANWILVTNRESLNELSKLNLYLRDQIADLFVTSIKFDLDLKQDFLRYIPKDSDSLMSDWWKQFVYDVKFRLKPIISSVLNLKNLIYNEEYKSLINSNNQDLFGFKLIYPEENGIDYEYFGFDKLTIKNFIDFFTTNQIDSSRLDEDWWDNFYKLLNLNIHLIDLESIKKANIFLSYTDSNRINISNKSISYFVIDDFRRFISWRDNLVLVNFKSTGEKKFLLKFLKLPQVNVDYFKNFIKIIHLSSYDNIDCLGTCDQVWNDLEFIKNNNLVSNEDYSFLYVPVLNEASKFLKIKDSYLSTIIGYDLINLVTSNLNLINFRNKSLEWELFFLKQKTNLPIIDKQDLIKNILFENLNKFDQDECKLACNILDLISYNRKFCELLYTLPVKCFYLNDSNYISLISNTCIKSVYNGLLPSIDIPSYAHDLAERLGVSVKIDLLNCVKVLTNLVNTNSTVSNLYIDWFINLKSNLNDQDIDLSGIELIYLNDSLSGDNGKKFYKISDIYCCQDSPGLLLICSYLNKSVISFNYNSVYKPIENILIKLGALTRPSLKDVITCLEMMSLDINLYNNQSTLSCLTNQGFESLKEIFLTLELELRHELGISQNQYIDVDINDLEKREFILNLVKSKKNELELTLSPIKIKLPLLTFDHHLRLHSEISHLNVLICFQTDFITSLKQIRSNSIFFNQTISKHCPFLLGLYNSNYMTNFIDIYLEHLTNNIEETNVYLNNQFRKATNLNQVQVLKTKYLSLSASIKTGNDQRSYNINNYIRYAIFNRKWIYISSRNLSDQGLSILLANALKSLLKFIETDKTDEELNLKAKNVISNMSKEHLYKSNWKVWENSSKKMSQFKINEIIFADDEYDSNKFIEVYFSNSNFERLSGTSNDRIRPSFLSDQDNYMNRLDMIDLNSLELNAPYQKSLVLDENNFKNLVPFKVDTENQKQCSIKAEHFFCCFLKKHYGESFNEYENWLSSARDIVYPSNSYYSDSLGYDFILKDERNLFFIPSNKGAAVSSKTCFIEVKGTEREWDGTFHLSKNELDKKESINNEKESYIIAVIEWASDPSRINIASLINWSSQHRLVSLLPESYFATYNQPQQRPELFSNNSTHSELNTENKFEALSTQKIENNRKNKVDYSNNSNPKDNTKKTENKNYSSSTYRGRNKKKEEPELEWRRHKKY